mmetsp:Transcript_18506/g.60758  ORF Transcript_18506/g.60758 Transcript_18506/m.60758 type:complete len:363 (-) Transcript_18506:50-1138(-)
MFLLRQHVVLSLQSLHVLLEGVLLLPEHRGDLLVLGDGLLVGVQGLRQSRDDSPLRSSSSSSRCLRPLLALVSLRRCLLRSLDLLLERLLLPQIRLQLLRPTLPCRSSRLLRLHHLVLSLSWRLCLLASSRTTSESCGFRLDPLKGSVSVRVNHRVQFFRSLVRDSLRMDRVLLGYRRLAHLLGSSPGRSLRHLQLPLLGKFLRPLKVNHVVVDRILCDLNGDVPSLLPEFVHEIITLLLKLLFLLVQSVEIRIFLIGWQVNFVLPLHHRTDIGDGNSGDGRSRQKRLDLVVDRGVHRLLKRLQQMPARARVSDRVAPCLQHRCARPGAERKSHEGDDGEGGRGHSRYPPCRVLVEPRGLGS